MSDKRSWRDKDRERDKSSHRKGEGSRGGKNPRVESATASYKRQLDAFFDRGVVPGHLKDKLPEGESVEPSGRQQRLRAIRDAKTTKALEKAFDALLADHDMPDEPDVWLRGLEHSKDAVLRQVLQKVEEYLDSGMPLPRKNRFLERIKGLEFTSFDPRVQSKAVSLSSRLR